MQFFQEINNGATPIPLDASPNLTPPNPSRIVRIPKGERVQVLSATPAVQAQALNGTTCTLRLWALEESTGTWVVISAGDVTTTPPADTTSSGSGFIGICALPDAQVFMQVVANTGVTKVGWFLAA
jgi:hypothetical protein